MKLPSCLALKKLAACFGATLPLVCLADTPDYEDWTARFQATSIWQRKTAFNASATGPNSLVPWAETSYTYTNTAYLGFRPWKDGELYLDPEITLGEPFSNLTGTAGFTNGEITRAAGSTPKLYRQRLFLRQTWNQGGGSEALESGLNQMAGSVDKNRFVLTVGNFSTLDMFDGNTYAKDPRSQFMNWGMMGYAAFDYAADARGFGWGFAGEWYRDDWVFRFGRMTGPKEPNAQPIDYRIGKHYGDQIELEHDHVFHGQPGKLRVLAWRNRAVTASYDDALAYLRDHPGANPEAILQVRNGEKIKYGLGVSIEQALNSDAGVFLRAMKADGRTETYAFTEVDASLGGGVSLKGTSWGRPQDTVGVGLMGNYLSRDRRQYLEAGGISFFIGDGFLNYRPERIFETYYSFAVLKDLSLTADFQRIDNPAYNADRGPVNIWSLRAHAEF